MLNVTLVSIQNLFILVNDELKYNGVRYDADRDQGDCNNMLFAINNKTVR